ncbi:MAG: hypothetical protein EOM84_02745 [Sphingobacteriia bacterium]|nr:hypothetical protein [Sphingobacteriia bacterium]
MKQKIKNIFKKPTKKALGKLGLFLVFGISIVNINFAYLENKASAATKEEAQRLLVETVDKQTRGLGFTTDGEGNVTGGKLKSPILPSGADLSKAMLGGVLLAVSELAKFSGLLLDLSLKQDFFRALVINDGVYSGWVIVRDILNMFFMLLLLFSAFATIFQVEKYHLRKIIIMLVVMALLVNFSYPIAIFVIDFSNSLMYFLIDNTFGTNASPSADVNKISEFGKNLKSASESTDEITSIILSIILVFIVFITFFSIALNLLIRILAFAVLLILAPVGFTFAFFPDTKSIANDWWSALFRYAFLGPIMAFFLYLGMSIFNQTNPIGQNSFFIKDFIHFIIPITFLWMGLIASQKFGGRGSEMAMSIARGTGNRVRRYSQTLAWGGTRMAGRGIDNAFGAPVAGTWNAVKNRWNQFGEDYKTASDRRAAEVGDRIGVRGANEKLVRENLKRLKDEGSSEAELTRLANGTVAERMASALFRAENNRFDNDPAIAQAQYNNAMNAVRGHQVYENQFLGNARKTNMDLVINERITQSGANTPAAIQTIVRDELGRLDPDQWRDQNIVRMVANTTPNRGTIIAEGANVISRYSQQGQDNVTRNMRGAKLDAGRHINNGGAGLWA